MRCYIIDDQEHVLTGLSQLVNNTPGLELVDVESDPVIALNNILTGKVKVDIVFVDVHMPDLNGVDLARSIQGKACIIFITGDPDFALDAFDIGAVDYLLKPISTVHFLRAIERARERMTIRLNPIVPETDQIYVRTNSRLTRVFINELMWVQGNNKYVNLYFNNAKPWLMVSNTLSHLESILPSGAFMRIHKSHIINLSYVLSISNNKVTLKDKTQLEVGATFQEGFYKRLKIL